VLESLPRIRRKIPPFFRIFSTRLLSGIFPVFQKEFWGIFDASRFREETYAKRDALARQE
jgi:hypothetical protein